MRTNQATSHLIYNPALNVPGKPDYWQTIRYIYQHLEFHISEDEAYVITNLFIEIWDESAGKLVYEEDIKKHVFKECRSRVMLFLPEEKIHKVCDLIFAYLRSVGQFL
ncbi:MAG: hypothetical protein JST76_02950 [Bacteroidetes bacterium]|nr:hypothetical protein [Bacteroidota bacterium]